MDVFPKEVSAIKSIFKSDSVSHDNKLFKLHHQVNYFFVLLGILFIFGQTYFGDPIQCYKEDDGYVKQFCWYHGSGHLPDKLSKNVSGCIADQKIFENGASLGEHEQRDQRHTKYYLWLPFVLAICLVIIKTPRFFWKNMCERGLMESIVANTPEKMAARILKLKGQRSFMYFLSFFFCEILNIISVVLCAIILDSLLGGNFWDYGTKVQNFYSMDALDRKSLDITNPMCNVFPTEVGCLITSAGINGELQHKNHLCMLSNNMFNQYYFLILWVWWVFLFSLSIVCLVFRALQLMVPAFSAAVFRSHLTQYNLQYRASDLEYLKMKQWDYFLLIHIINNLKKGSNVEELLTEMSSIAKGMNGKNDPELIQTKAI